MRTYGPLYAGRLEYYHTKFLPILEIGSTQETEGRYRKGKCLVFRAPFTKPGYYFGVFYTGFFRDHLDEDEIDQMLFTAMKSRNAWKPEDGMYDEFFEE
jgi:hypothetical protein